MKVIHDISEWKKIRTSIPAEQTLGFVATMGNLHAGHASLCQRALAENNITIVSIFVNPTQFDNPQDLVCYPRTPEQDIDLLTKLGVTYCFIPSIEQIYPDNNSFQLHETHLAQRLEGVHRKGHFTGMLTVVMKLLQIIRPNRAYFGEKDYQQLTLIKNMVAAFFMDVEIIACPTIREHSMLALSSRNNRLSPQQHELAAQFASIFHQNRSCDEIIQSIHELGIKVEYIEAYQQRRYAAVWIDDIRLIDNYPLSD